MSKAKRIRELYAEGKTCAEIAAIIPCRVEYVRICARQRAVTLDGAVKGMSKADYAYLIKKHGSMAAYFAHNNEKTKPVRRAYYAKRWREDADYRAKCNERKRDQRRRKRNAHVDANQSIG